MARTASNELINIWLEKVSLVSAQLPLAKLKLAVYVLALVWVVNNLVTLVWLYVPMPEIQVGSTMAPVKAKQMAKDSLVVDIRQLQELNLFGQMDESIEKKEVAPVVTQLEGIEDEAVATRLQLTLQGVAVAEDPANSRAMIEHKNKQDLYIIGDKLPVGPRVELAKILSDRVILDNGGRYESLLLYDENAIRQSKRSRGSKSRRKPELDRENVVDQRNNSEITDMATQYRKQLLSNPTSLAEVIKVSVAKDADGTVIGYRVRPGKDRRQFQQFGFQAGDIVTQINGIELNNPTKALEVYRLMREAQEATFEVKRGDEELTFMVSLGESE